MKRIAAILSMTVAFTGLYAMAQQPIPPVDPNAPSLTLEEKIALTTDDVKKQDVLEKLQKQYMDAIKPITDHQDAARAAIEKEHDGWILEQGPTGWHFVKKPAPKPADGPRPDGKAEQKK